MLLNDVSLYLDYEYPRSLVNLLSLQARCVGHFLRRRLKEAKFCSNGFRMIAVIGIEEPAPEAAIVPDRALGVEVYFDQQRFERLKGDELQEYFIELLEEGFRKAARSHDIPLDLLLEGLKDFRAGGYKDEWLHQEKLLRPHRLKAALSCQVTMWEFILTLTVREGDKVIFSKPIHRDLPDETCYHHKFKDLKHTPRRLQVTSRLWREPPLFAMTLPGLKVVKEGQLTRHGPAWCLLKARRRELEGLADSDE